MFYAEKKLQQRLTEIEGATENEDLIIQIKAALKFLDDEFKEQKERLELLLKEAEISFDLLWAIFPPKCLVCTVDLFGEPAIHQLQGHSGSMARQRANSFSILGRTIDTDGENWGWTVAKELQIPEFTGVRPISSLPVFPLEFHLDKNLREKMVARGAWRLGFPEVRLYNYSGPAYRERGQPSSKDTLVKFHVSTSRRSAAF